MILDIHRREGAYQQSVSVSILNASSDSWRGKHTADVPSEPDKDKTTMVRLSVLNLTHDSQPMASPRRIQRLSGKLGTSKATLLLSSVIGMMITKTPNGEDLWKRSIRRWNQRLSIPSKPSYQTPLSLRKPLLKHCSIWLSLASCAILSHSFRPADTSIRVSRLFKRKYMNFRRKWFSTLAVFSGLLVRSCR